jgi:hypothetical protein
MDDSWLALFDQHKEERRGSGRKGTPTNKARQKRNCSRSNHGCHGYWNEKSLSKSKGHLKTRSLHLLDAQFVTGHCREVLFDSSRRLDPIRVR